MNRVENLKEIINPLRIFFFSFSFFHLRVFAPFSRDCDWTGAPLKALVTVREKNSSQSSKLERDSKRKSFIFSTNFTN